MLELFDRSPSSRVFHVDRECYVVYLGSHWDDYRPFLRIGTSTALPPALPPIVSSIVVPDVLTGNPIDEPASVAGDATPGTHYIGDVETVERVKEFAGHLAIPVEAIEVVDHEDDDPRHVLVYYYRDGNIRIKFRKTEVFDLRRREQLDGHFVARAQDAKNEYSRGPFKLPGEVYQDPGFLVVSGVPYLAARGELAALRLTDDGFFALCAAGLDADRVTTVCCDDADTALIRYFKRSRTKPRPVRVVTPRAERAGAAAALFRENSLPGLTANVLPGGGAFDFHRYAVTRASGRVEARLDGSAGTLVIGEGVKRAGPDAIVVDPAAGRLTLPGSRGALPVLDGCYYRIDDVRLSRSEIELRYLPEKNYAYRDLLTDAENTLLSQLAYYCNELHAGRDTGKVLRTIKGLDPVKAIGRPAGLHPMVQLVLSNYRSYLEFIQLTEPDRGKEADGLLALLGRHEVARDEIPSALPLVGEIGEHGGRTFLFYRFAARITADRYANAQRIAAAILTEPSFDFETERARLSELISALATPEQMDEARLRRIAERKKKQSAADEAKDKAKAGAAGQPADDAGGRTSAGEAGGRTGTGGRPGVAGSRAGGAARGAAGSTGGRTGRSRRGRGRSWFLPVAAVLLVLVALFALLWYGVIPNPWIGPEGTLVRRGEPATVTDPTTGADDVATVDPDADASDPDAVDPDAIDPDADATGPADGDADVSVTDAGDAPVTLPEGWPPDALPAFRALQETPGIIITDRAVIGPGGIEITLFDIIDLVNRIATENGYHVMGAVGSPLPDPDWIYPGNVFALPDATRYIVVDGDTLWGISVRYLVARLQRDHSSYTRLVSDYESATTESQKSDIVSRLRELGDGSHAVNFARLIEQTIARLQESGRGEE